MNYKTKQTIENFVKLTPDSIDVPVSHCTDRDRVFDIAIAAFEAQEARSDVYDELSALIHEKHFLHEKDLIDAVKHDLSILLDFLMYQQKK